MCQKFKTTACLVLILTIAFALVGCEFKEKKNIESSSILLETVTSDTASVIETTSEMDIENISKVSNEQDTEGVSSIQQSNADFNKNEPASSTQIPAVNIPSASVPVTQTNTEMPIQSAKITFPQVNSVVMVGDVNVTWDNVKDAVGYRVTVLTWPWGEGYPPDNYDERYSYGPEVIWKQDLGKVNKTTIPWTFVVPGQKYRVMIGVLFASGERVLLPEINFTIKSELPLPSIINPINNSRLPMDAINVTWNIPTGANDWTYTLFIKDNTGYGGPHAPIPIGNVTTFRLRGEGSPYGVTFTIIIQARSDALKKVTRSEVAFTYKNVNEQ